MENGYLLLAQQSVNAAAHRARLFQGGNRLGMHVHALVGHTEADQGRDHRFGELAVQLPE